MQMAQIYEITDGYMHDDFIAAHNKAVIFFGSKSCGHCIHMLPVYEELAQQYPNIGFAHIEVTKVNPKPINLEGVPSFAIYRNHIAVDKVVGARENELRQALSNL